MKPTTFPAQTLTLNEGQPNETPVHIDPLHGIVTVCYEATPEELAAINENGGKVHICFAMLFPNMPYPIIEVTPTLEMRELTEDERAKVETAAKRNRVVENRNKRNPSRLNRAK